MTQTNFVRVSGWGMIVAAVCLLLTFTQVAETFPLFLVVNLLITLGLVGLHVRYGERAGNVAKFALGMGIFGGFASVVSYFLWMSDAPNGRILMNLAMAVMFGGLFVFGLIAQAVKPMPRGNWLPALAGFWWVFLATSAYVNPQASGQGVPFWASFAMFCVMSFCLASLGYVLQANVRQARGVA